jgi:hypothetical protein
MNNKSEQNLISICSVTQMAGKLGLSRARFYQLQNTGVFPPPVYCMYSQRPFYPAELQEICFEIRRTGVGYNRRPVRFNSKRESGSTGTFKNCSEHKYQELSYALEQMGLKMSPAKAGKALMILYPSDWEKIDINGEVIVEVFRYFQNGV